MRPVPAYAPPAEPVITHDEPPAPPKTVEPVISAPVAQVPIAPAPAAITPAPAQETQPVATPQPAAPTPEPTPTAPVKESAVSPTPGDSHTTPLDEAIAAAPAPHSAPTQDAQPPAATPAPTPAPPEPEREERPPLAEPRDEDLHTPDFEQLNEDFDRLAMEAHDEADMLGLESEEHDSASTHTGRYEVFSLQDSSITTMPHVRSILTPDADEDADEDAESMSAPRIDLEADGRQTTWAKVVAHIRIFHAPLAATLEHAYIEEFTSDKISMTYIQRYSHFVNDDKRLGILKNMLKEIFGESFEVIIGTRFEDVPLPGFETLAQLRDAALRARRDQLADDTEHHPVVKEAHSLFTPTASRIMVALHED